MKNNSVHIPYQEIDRKVLPLVRFINSFDGLHTISSRGGHPDTRPGHLPEDCWQVAFSVNIANDRISTSGWLALEFLVWACRSIGQEKVELRFTAEPPFIHGVGSTLVFMMEGKGHRPIDLTEELAGYRDEYFVREIGFPFVSFNPHVEDRKQGSLF